jgi:hypothetical protein
MEEILWFFELARQGIETGNMLVGFGKGEPEIRSTEVDILRG